jgi:hypothetical protein
MRLARPVYESLPLGYLCLGLASLGVSYMESNGARAVVPFVLGLLALVAGSTVFLHRCDCRRRRDQYPCETIDDALRSH